MTKPLELEPMKQRTTLRLVSFRVAWGKPWGDFIYKDVKISAIIEDWSFVQCEYFPTNHYHFLPDDTLDVDLQITHVFDVSTGTFAQSYRVLQVHDFSCKQCWETLNFNAGIAPPRSTPRTPAARPQRTNKGRK